MAEPPDWCVPGARVKCIHADRHFLEKGRVYTVHETMATPHPLKSDCLIGLEWPMREMMMWGLWRFRRHEAPGDAKPDPPSEGSPPRRSAARRTG